MGYNAPMPSGKYTPSAKQTLEQQYLEMRWRALSLAADFDRIERAEGGPALLEDDQRLRELRQALRIILDARSDRAQRVQDLLSDHTPPPER